MPSPLPVLADACGHWHDYGKSPREGRKVGHATLRADSPDALAAALESTARGLDRDAQVRPVLARLRNPA
jgi:5-(carboxyamino)imidazole ribonucleotide synthase